MQQEIVFDIESNGFIFESTEIWTICAKNVQTGDGLTINPFKDSLAKEKFLNFVFKSDCPFIIAHNHLGFDMFVLMNVLGINFTVGPDTIEGKPVQFVDTFYLSMFLNPDREGHSIDYFGSVLGLPKIDWRARAIEVGVIDSNSEKGAEFMQHHPEMDVYCRRDIDVGEAVYLYLKKEWHEMYQQPFHITDAFKCGQKAFYLMSCQELTGWKFDVEKAEKLKVKIESMMEEIRAEVEPKLPPRQLKKTEQKAYTMPAKPFKKDGTYSSSWMSFTEKHKGKEICHGEWEFYGEKYSVESGKVLNITLPMEMANQDQMKDFFLQSGWKPTLFNYQRGPDGKPMRDPVTRQLIPTTPKIQEAGKICPNLMKLEGDIAKQVVKWLSLRNRLSVLQGWMENPRLRMDGRIGAGRTGIAATHRQKHKVVVNVPKADPNVLLGEEFRSLWISEDGMLIAAGDAAALEGRVQGHYCVPMDTQALTKRGWKSFDELVDGEDILAYNPETGMKEWTPLLEKCVFEDAEVFAIENNNFKVRTTANHRWFVEYRNTTTGTYNQKVVETRDLNTCCNIITNAPMADYSGTVSGMLDGKYGQNWTGRVVSRGLNGVESFIEGFLVADGHYSNQNADKGADTQEKGKGRWRFGQNLGEHFDAALTAAYIAHRGYLNVAYRETPTNRMGIVTLNKKSTVTMQRMTIKSTGSERVWCPRTKFGSWVMRQGDVITITGNTYKYDDGVTADELLRGDVHSKNANAFYGGIHKEVSEMYNSPTFNKEDPKWKPYRNKSKGGFYCILYGGGGPKVAATLGIPEKYGKKALDAFWEANPGTAKLKENLENYWEKKGQCKYLPAIDGRMLRTRKKSALLNTIFQSCGGISMDYACCFLDKWLGGIQWKDRKPYYLYKGCVVRRIGYFHDEVEFECEEPVAEEVARLIEKAIEKAGEYLKLKVPLAGEGKVGKSWLEVH